MREDIALVSEKKAEIVAVLRNYVTVALGGKVSFESSKPRAAPRGGTAMRQVEMVKVIYAYAAAQSDELSLREGDMIELESRIDQDWWTGKNTTSGQRGVFPATYVENLGMQSVPAPGGAQYAVPAANHSPNNYLLPVAFNNDIPLRAATVAKCSRSAKGGIAIETSMYVNGVSYSAKPGRVLVTVAPGVTAQQLQAVQDAQARRAAKEEQERQALAEARKANADARAAQRAADKRARIQAKKARKKEERERRNAAMGNSVKGRTKFGNSSNRSNGARGGAKPAAVKSSTPPWVARKKRMEAQAKEKPAVRPKSWKKAIPTPAPVKKSAWETHTDPSSGDTYYYNPQTQESTWDMPAELKAAQSAAPASGGSRSSGTPSAAAGSMGYRELLDAKASGGASGPNLETYLRADAYQDAFGMSKAAFDALPGWKKTAAKKKASLF